MISMLIRRSEPPARRPAPPLEQVDMDARCGVTVGGLVDAGRAEQRVVAQIAGDHVVAGAAVEVVVPGAADQAVVAPDAADAVSRSAADQRIIARRSGLCRHAFLQKRPPL